MKVKTEKKYIIGNWKMHPNTLIEAKEIFSTLKKQKYQSQKTVNIVCPPFVFLSELAKVNKDEKFFIGAQDCSFENGGPINGKISAQMLKSIGCSFVILGHSSRRIKEFGIGETNEEISKKVASAFKAGLKVILCIGEENQKEDGSHLKEIQDQIDGSLQGISLRNIAHDLVIAYEPVWAISQGKKDTKPMGSHEIHQSSMFVRTILLKKYGKNIGPKIPVIYGGSSNAGNAYEIVYKGEVDGLLVGSASLDPKEFSTIIKDIGAGKKNK